MAIKLVYDFPEFDSGLFEKATFEMSKGDASLFIEVAETDNILLKFSRIRWHEFTANYNCSSEQISAYFKLVELTDSESLTKYIESDRAGRKAYKELHHFRVYLDEHGCHEIFAESASYHEVT